MNDLFTRPANELDFEMVQQLVGIAVEDQTTEFKVGLSTEDGSVHLWQEETSRTVDDHARDDILKEVVAFANADGGNIIIGMAQSRDAEHRAAKIKVLPNCRLLADRLRQLSSSYIEPQCLGMEWIGICNGDETNDGVVLVRVPRSGDAPHRLSANKEFYIRREKESQPMTVQEIRDVTIRRTSEVLELQSRLDHRREKVRECLEAAYQSGQHRVAARITVVPILARVLIQHAYRHQQELFPPLRDFKGTVTGKNVSLPVPSQINELRLQPVRPLLRAGHRSHRSTDQRVFVEHEVHSDGLTEIFLNYEPRDISNTCPLFLSSTMCLVANMLTMADRVRRFAEIPNAELTLDMEIGFSQAKPSPTLYGFQELQHAGVGDVESGTIQSIPLQLPRYSILSADEFPLVAATVFNDLRESAGLQAVDDFTIDFD